MKHGKTIVYRNTFEAFILMSYIFLNYGYIRIRYVNRILWMRSLYHIWDSDWDINTKHNDRSEYIQFKSLFLLQQNSLCLKKKEEKKNELQG